MKNLFFVMLFIIQVVGAAEYVTYNVGLAHSFVKHAQERLPHIIKALQSEDADLYCLQEVWRASDRDQIITGLKERYPYAHFVLAKQKEAKLAPACGFSDLLGKGSFGRCVIGKCRKYAGDKLTDCVLRECTSSMLKLIQSNRECALGLMSNVGGSPIGAMFSILNPFKKAGLFAYEGSNGLLMLSKKELSEKGVYDYSDISTLNRRATLFAKVGKTKIYCSHLTANLGGVAFYGGDLESWEKENQTQIKQMIAKIPLGQDPLLIMGDFNCSMKKKDVKADFSDNCEQFFQAGLKEPYWKDPHCTFCEKNSLVSVQADYLLDHIFTSQIGEATVKRVFLEKVFLKDVGQDHNLSDHFGLKIKIQ